MSSTFPFPLLDLIPYWPLLGYFPELPTAYYTYLRYYQHVSRVFNNVWLTLCSLSTKVNLARSLYSSQLWKDAHCLIYETLDVYQLECDAGSRMSFPSNESFSANVELARCLFGFLIDNLSCPNILSFSLILYWYILKALREQTKVLGTGCLWYPSGITQLMYSAFFKLTQRTCFRYT